MKNFLIKSGKKYNLLDIFLLKYQNSNNNSKIGKHLKHALKIIYQFNKNKKIIWFVGFNSFVPIKNLIFNSKHVFLPNDFWIKGLIGNRKFVKSKIKSSNFKTPNLVVIFDCNSRMSETVKELNKQDIPIIIFGSFSKISLRSCYIKFVPIDNFENKIKSFCFFLVYSILKKV